jgi:hypothetical protein
MWAIATDVEISDSKAAQDLLPDVVSRVRAAPGFVTGHWVQLDEGHGTALVIFDSEENARAGVPKEGDSPGPGVVFSRVRVGEVAGHA